MMIVGSAVQGDAALLTGKIWCLDCSAWLRHAHPHHAGPGQYKLTVRARLPAAATVRSTRNWVVPSSTV